MRERTYWIDHVLSPTSQFTVIASGTEDVYTITPYGTIMQQGTAQDAEHFNSIEEGLAANELATYLLINHARQQEWKLEELEDIGDEVETLSNTVSTLDSSVSSLSTQVSTNTTNIATNTKNIATNTSNITTNTTNISTLNSSLSTLSSTVSSNTSNISTNTSDIATLNTSLSSLSDDVSALSDDVAEIESTVSDLDDIKSDFIVQYETVTLTNTLDFPFNDSQITVALPIDMPNIYYRVETEVISADGNVGEIEVTEKQTNGFKIAYTGSATSVEIQYIAVSNYYHTIVTTTPALSS